MHRRDLLRAIARATGDTHSTIKRLGFQLEAVTLQKGRFKNLKQSRDIRTFRMKTKACTCWSLQMNNHVHLLNERRSKNQKTPSFQGTHRLISPHC